MGVKLPVLYVCLGCGGDRRELEIEPRAKGEGVVVWFENMKRVVVFHHEIRRPPTCKADALKDLRFPLSKRDGAGVGEWTEADADEYATKKRDWGK